MEGRVDEQRGEVRTRLKVLVLASDEAYQEWWPDAKKMEPAAEFVRVKHRLDVKGSPRRTEVILLDGWLTQDAEAIKAMMRMAGKRIRVVALALAQEMERPRQVVASMLEEEFRVWRNTAAALEAVRLKKETA